MSEIPDSAFIASFHDEGGCYLGDIAASSLRALRAENERLREALKEAIECVEFWADYASPYFKDKHGLEDNLIKLRAAIKDAPR